jgi:hypothetical protein
MGAVGNVGRDLNDWLVLLALAKQSELPGKG